MLDEDKVQIALGLKIQCLNCKKVKTISSFYDTKLPHANSCYDKVCNKCCGQDSKCENCAGRNIKREK